MKIILFYLMIFILPVFLFSQDQNASQVRENEDRLRDITPDRELAQPPSPSNTDVPAQVKDNEDSWGDITPDRELAQPPPMSNTDVPAQVKDNEDRLRDINPDRIEPSESYKTED